MKLLIKRYFIISSINSFLKYSFDLRKIDKNINYKKKKKTKKKNRFVCISVYRAYFHFFLLIHFNYFKLSNRKKRSLQLLLAIMKRKKRKLWPFNCPCVEIFRFQWDSSFIFFLYFARYITVAIFIGVYGQPVSLLR